ncbi:MAG: ABC transporter permease [Candidatus Binatia bacterium]
MNIGVLTSRGPQTGNQTTHSSGFGSLIKAPIANVHMWVGLGWIDLVQNYRRTFLGPFWITVNLAIFAAAMTLVYGALFGVPSREYAGYIVCGMLSWMWVSALLTEVGMTFINYGHFLKNIPIDKALFVWAAVYKLTITLAHNLIVYAALVVFGFVELNMYTLMAIPAVAILFLFSIPITAMAAILFARYRDIQRLIASGTVVIMMVTPIFWQSTMITGWRAAIVHLNPIYYLVEFLRAPLLGRPLEMTTILVVLGMTAIAWVVGSFFYRRYEKYVIFWI